MKLRLLALLLTITLAPTCFAQADLFSVHPFTDDIFVFDRTTGSSTFSAKLTMTGEVVTGATGAALHPTTNVIYAIVKTQSGGSNRVLATLDRTTGIATAIGSLGDSFSSIAFDSSGVLWGVTGDGATTPETLYTIDISTATPTFVQALGNGADGEVIAYNPVDGLMYHASGNGTVEFESINLTTGAVTPISTSTGEVFGMVWDPIAGHFISCNINSNLQTVTTAGVFTPGPTLDDSVVGNIDARGLIILPHITSSTSSLNLGTTVQGTASTPQSFDVAGTNLVGDLTITPPTGVVVSLTVSGGFGSSLSLTPTAGAVASTTIFARIQASAPTGAINDFIVLTTTAGDSVDITVTGDVTGPPEIEVSRTGPGTIASGGDDPIAGSVDGVQIDLTYDIDEVGGSDVLFGTPSVTAVGTTGAPGVVIAAGPADASTLTANGNVQLDLEITPSAAGAWVVTVTINSDAATNPYTFTISGTAAATPTPELELSRVGAGVLANGATDTIFGTVDAVMTTLTYDLENIGSATLTFGATSVEVTGSTGTPTVTLVGAPAGSSTMIVGATAAFDVQVTPSAAGAWSATIAINSDGSTGGVHTFTISGTAQATVAPEIAVLRSSTNITNGGTDNAGAATGTAPFVLTYTIRNEGSDVLLLTGGGTLVAAGSPTNCAALVTDPASSSVAAGGGTVTFSVQVTPIATGAFSFTLSIANDDADENPFTFTVNGNTGGTTGGGGGDDDDDSCSTSTGSSWWLVVLGLVGVVAVATRARGSRA